MNSSEDNYLNDKYNSKLRKIWNENSVNSLAKYAPCFFAQLKKSKLTFVGLNPSFPKRKKEKNEAAYIWNKLSESQKDQLIIEEQNNFGSYKPYYRKFRQISNEICGSDHTSNWNHLDVFAVRETKSKVLMDYINLNKTDLFIRHQLSLFRELLIELKPSTVVVCNANASRIIKELFALVYNIEFGFFESKNSDLSNPFHLGCMVSGTRAMDIFSFQRLIWHIKKTPPL